MDFSLALPFTPSPVSATGPTPPVNTSPVDAALLTAAQDLIAPAQDVGLFDAVLSQQVGRTQTSAPATIAAVDKQQVRIEKETTDSEPATAECVLAQTEWATAPFLPASAVPVGTSAQNAAAAAGSSVERTPASDAPLVRPPVAAAVPPRDATALPQATPDAVEDEPLAELPAMQPPIARPMNFVAETPGNTSKATSERPRALERAEEAAQQKNDLHAFNEKVLARIEPAAPAVEPVHRATEAAPTTPAHALAIPVAEASASGVTMLTASAPAPTLSTPTAQVTTVHIATHVNAPAWDAALGNSVVWLAGHEHHAAELRLNPPELGPVAVTLNVSRDEATALFVAHHPDVREAIESALPRLREMFAENGIALGHAAVSADTPQQNAQDPRAALAQREHSSNFAANLDGVALPHRSRLGLIDTFA